MGWILIDQYKITMINRKGERIVLEKEFEKEYEAVLYLTNNYKEILQDELDEYGYGLKDFKFEINKEYEFILD
jgi:hypothetical protein